MAVRKRYKKKHRALKAFVLAVVIVVVGLWAFYAVSDFLRDNQQKIYESQYPRKYSEYVEKYSDIYGVDSALVYATIRTESRFNKDAKSSAGAYGLMQITEDTLHFLKNSIPGDATDYTAEDLYNPEINIKFGTYFLSWLLNKYEEKSSAVAAYNAGFGNVDKWLESEEYSSDGVSLSHIPFPETKHYVDKVLKAEQYYKNIYG